MSSVSAARRRDRAQALAQSKIALPGAGWGTPAASKPRAGSSAVRLPVDTKDKADSQAVDTVFKNEMKRAQSIVRPSSDGSGTPRAQSAEDEQADLSIADRPISTPLS